MTGVVLSVRGLKVSTAEFRPSKASIWKYAQANL